MANKYGARKTLIDGVLFDSMKEASFYQQLLLEKRAGNIIDFELQPKFILQEGFIVDDKKIRAITYTADFLVFHGGYKEIIDVKGMQTEVFRLKWKMLMHKLSGQGYRFSIV